LDCRVCTDRQPEPLLGTRAVVRDRSNIHGIKSGKAVSIGTDPNGAKLRTMWAIHFALASPQNPAQFSSSLLFPSLPFPSLAPFGTDPYLGMGTGQVPKEPVTRHAPVGDRIRNIGPVPFAVSSRHSEHPPTLEFGTGQISKEPTTRHALVGNRIRNIGPVPFWRFCPLLAFVRVGVYRSDLGLRTEFIVWCHEISFSIPL
jgi:hypothetical protein